MNKELPIEEICIDLSLVQRCELDVESPGEILLPQEPLLAYHKQQVINSNWNRASFPFGVANNFLAICKSSMIQDVGYYYLLV